MNGPITEAYSDGRFISIDWLRYSVPWPGGVVSDGENISQVLAGALYPSPALTLTGEYLPVPQGYDTCLRASHGSVRYHSERVEQKIGIEHTGRDLAELRAAGVPSVELVRHAAGVGRVTRLDLAVDIFGQSIDVTDMYRAFQAGTLDTAAHSVNLVERKVRTDKGLASGGATVYIGSQSSERFIRIYDKAAEQGIDGVPWTRIEIVLGGDVAAAFAPVLLSPAWEEVAQAAMRAFCDTGAVSWYHDAVSGPCRALPVLPRKDTNRFRWLMAQVLPALKTELIACELREDWRLFEAFDSALEIYRHREGRR